MILQLRVVGSEGTSSGVASHGLRATAMGTSNHSNHKSVFLKWKICNVLSYLYDRMNKTEKTAMHGGIY